MWVLVMFDLPVETREKRHIYVKFRKWLLENGFRQMQYSVYYRSCMSEENAAMHRARVKDQVPDEGHVRILTFTDKQFGRMEVFFGKCPKEAEKPPDQLSFF